MDAAVTDGGALVAVAEGGPVAAPATLAGGTAMASTSRVVIGLAVGAALGLAGGLALGTLWSGGAPPPPPPGPGHVAPDPGGPPGAAPRAPDAARTPGPRATRRPVLGGREISPEEEEFLVAALGDRRLRLELSRIEDADGGLDILARVRKANPDLDSLLWDFGKVSSHVRTGEGTARQIPSSGAATEVNLDDLAGQAAVVEFGPGRFTFEAAARKFHDLRGGLESLEIRGAGPDATTIEGGPYSFLMVLGTLRNFRVRDLTFDGGPRREGTLDVRGATSAVFERVRFQGIQNAGHGAPIGVSGSLYLGMKDCEFLGSGEEFGLSVRGQTLCLLERCTFMNLQAAIIGDNRREDSAVHLLDCTFEGTPVADSRVRAPDGKGPKFPIRVRGGQVRLGPPDMTEEGRREAWGSPFLAEERDVAFAPGTPGSTLNDLLQALDRAVPREGETVVRAEAAAVGLRGPGSFVISFRVDATGKDRHELHRRTPEGWEAGEYGGGRPWIPPEEETRGALGLAAAARMSGIPTDTAALQIGYGRPMPREAGDRVPSIQIEAGRHWQQWVLDAGTGEVLLPRMPSGRAGGGGAGGR